MTNTSKPDFIAKINDLRKSNKNSWYTWTGTVNHKIIQIKGFKTWLQIFRIDGLQVNTVMDCSVKEFNKSLDKV